MLVDIFITYKNREELFKKSFESFIENTNRDICRVTVICDGFGVPSWLSGKVDSIIENKDNKGLGPCINTVLSKIQSDNAWNSTSPLQEDKKLVSDFICYCQDDLLYTQHWLEKLMQMFLLFEKQYNLGFASGIECVEHKTKKVLSKEIILKDWIRAANMFARTDYWLSMAPISALDPETGRKRAKPNDGMGSGVDWWFIRNHPNSVCKTNKTCLVMPGLLTHLGYKESTWLSRELPESDKDKEFIKQNV